MKKSQMTKVLIEADPALLAQLATEVEEVCRVELIREPERSLVMTKARDSVSLQPFYIGEVLITECTVSVDGINGFGALLGEQPERAYQLALVDGAMNAKHPVTAHWAPVFEQAAAQVEHKHRVDHTRMLKTKVNFDTLEENYGNR